MIVAFFESETTQSLGRELERFWQQHLLLCIDMDLYIEVLSAMYGRKTIRRPEWGGGYNNEFPQIVS